jgi:hypothetical protein
MPCWPLRVRNLPSIAMTPVCEPFSFRDLTAYIPKTVPTKGWITPYVSRPGLTTIAAMALITFPLCADGKNSDGLNPKTREKFAATTTVVLARVDHTVAKALLTADTCTIPCNLVAGPRAGEPNSKATEELERTVLVSSGRAFRKEPDWEPAHPALLRWELAPVLAQSAAPQLAHLDRRHKEEGTLYIDIVSLARDLWGVCDYGPEKSKVPRNGDKAMRTGTAYSVIFSTPGVKRWRLPFRGQWGSEASVVAGKGCASVVPSQPQRGTFEYDLFRYMYDKIGIR